MSNAFEQVFNDTEVARIREATDKLIAQHQDNDSRIVEMADQLARKLNAVRAMLDIEPLKDPVIWRDSTDGSCYLVERQKDAPEQIEMVDYQKAVLNRFPDVLHPDEAAK